MKYKISYIGDGAQAEFQFAFPFFQPADICVAINDVACERGVDFTVVPNNRFDGGSVIMIVPPPDGAQIDIFRKISLNRVIDYQPTDRILPQHLNSDFNFLLEALREIDGINIDLAEWNNTHDNILGYLKYAVSLIQDSMSQGALGIFNNLLSVLADARPYLINDYGLITDTAPEELRDDYGIL